MVATAQRPASCCEASTAQAGAIEQLGHEPEQAVAAGDGIKDATDLVGGGDDRQALRAFGVHVAQAAEEDDGVERLVLRAGGDVAVDGQMREELLDMGAAEVAGMAFTVMKRRAQST
jgi:hypothetical protein